METAYVLVNTLLNEDTEVAKAIRLLEGVKEVHLLYGVYDIIVKVEAESMADLKQRVAAIDKITDVRSTLKMILISP